MGYPLCLLPMTTRSQAEAGAVFALGRRTAWTFTLRVATVGAALTLEIQTSPTGEEGTWTARKTITTPAVGTQVIKSSDADGGSATTIPGTDEYLRAQITAITGNWTLGLEGSAPFFDALDDDDLALLAEEVRTSSEVERLAARAEEDVLAYLTTAARGAIPAPGQDIWRPALLCLLGRAPWVPPLLEPNTDAAERRATVAPGRALDFAAELTGAADAIRAEIVLQVEHLARKARLAASAEPSALVTLRQLGDYPDGFGRRLAPYRESGAGLVWRGR